MKKIVIYALLASLLLTMAPTVEAQTVYTTVYTKEEEQTETFCDMGWVQDRNALQFLKGSLVTWRWEEGKKKGRIIGERNVWNQKERLWKYVTLSHDCLKEKIKGKKRVVSMCEGMDGKLYLLCKGKDTDKVHLIVAKASGKILKAKSISLQPLLKRENGKSVKKWKCGDMRIVDKDTVVVSYTSHTADMTKKKKGVWFIKLNSKKTSVLELENYLWKLGDGVAYGEKKRGNGKNMRYRLSIPDISTIHIV